MYDKMFTVEIVLVKCFGIFSVLETTTFNKIQTIRLKMIRFHIYPHVM